MGEKNLPELPKLNLNFSKGSTKPRRPASPSRAPKPARKHSGYGKERKGRTTGPSTATDPTVFALGLSAEEIRRRTERLTRSRKERGVSEEPEEERPRSPEERLPEAGFCILNFGGSDEEPLLALVQEDRGDKKEREVPLWKLPGGQMDPGDTCCREAAERECPEETGLSLKASGRAVYDVLREEYSSPVRFRVWEMETAGHNEGDMEMGEEIARLQVFTWPEVEELVKRERVLLHHAAALYAWRNQKLQASKNRGAA